MSFVTAWTVAHQAPLTMGFPRQEYQCGLPFLSAGDLPDTGIEPGSPALVGGFFTTELLKFFFQTDEALEFFQIANIY